MMRYVALLRGINLSGKNRLPMAGLRDLLDELGYENVRTYIQSGNIIFDAPEADEATRSRNLQDAIAERFDVVAPVVLRTRSEFEDLAAACPFNTESIEPTRLHVMLLSDVPAPEAVAQLDPERSPGDSFIVHNREIYLHLPNGAARSKLTVNYFDRVLGVTATGRNWNTIEKLLTMLTA